MSLEVTFPASLQGEGEGEARALLGGTRHLCPGWPWSALCIIQALAALASVCSHPADPNSQSEICLLGCPLQTGAMAGT